MMEVFLPRQHKRSFVFLLKISSSQRCCHFYSPPLSLGTCGVHDSTSLVLWANKGAGKVLLIFFLSLSICISPLTSLIQVQSLQPKHLCTTLLPASSHPTASPHSEIFKWFLPYCLLSPQVLLKNRHSISVGKKILKCIFQFKVTTVLIKVLFILVLMI